ncbi:MAG: DUF4162 domain-containing protein, partial [Candidatus Omnitrophica bacterium]|nr:DUF4162 domain-containing protein [Candidatus Omnitrophota bacterium]
TAGLDLELRYKMWDFFRETNQKGITIFLTTHYIEEAEKLCNRIGVIHAGAMIEVDDKERLMKRMSQNTIEIKLDRRLETVPENLSEFGVELVNRGDTVRLRENDQQLSKLLRSIHAHGIEVLNVHVKKTTLEEVFFKLIRNDHEKSNRF